MSCSSNGQTDLDSGNPSPGHGNPLPKHSNRPPSAKSLRKPASPSLRPSPTPIQPNGRSLAATSPTGKSNTTLRFSPSGATALHRASPKTPSTYSDCRSQQNSTSCSNPKNTSTGNGSHGKKLLRNASHGPTKKPSNTCQNISSTTDSSSHGLHQ